MEIGIKNPILKEGAKKLGSYSDQLDGPLETFKKNAAEIGEGGAAWNGTAAERATQVLKELQADILKLQNAGRELANTVNATVEVNEAAHDQVTQTIDSVKA